jgi:hypothetical protein
VYFLTIINKITMKNWKEEAQKILDKHLTTMLNKYPESYKTLEEMTKLPEYEIIINVMFEFARLYAKEAFEAARKLVLNKGSFERKDTNECYINMFETFNDFLTNNKIS